MSGKEWRSAWKKRTAVNCTVWRFTRGNIHHLSVYWVVPRSFIRCITSDQSVLSCLTKIFLPPAGIIAQVTCQIQPLTLMTGGKHDTKNCCLTIKAESSSLPLPLWLLKDKLTVNHTNKHADHSEVVTYPTLSSCRLSSRSNIKMVISQ